MELNQIYQGDCLDLMPAIPAGSIDMILADLPYGTTACHWDSVIPLEPLWAEYKRIIKPNGAIVLTGSQPFTSVLVMSNLEWFKYEWVWEKNTASNVFNSERQPIRYHESILVFYLEQPTFNKQLAKRKESAKQRIRSGIKSNPETSKHYTGVKNQFKRNFYDVDYINPKSTLYFNAVPNCNGGKLHPTQKPVSLFAYLIRTYSNPGEVVLDNVAGSGTTAIAAIETGRQWLCIEKDQDYYQLAKRRIEKRLMQPFLPGTVEAEVKPEQLEFA